MGRDPGEITQLLQQWRTGDRQVEDRLFDLLLPEMHQIAKRCFRGQRPGNSLQPTLAKSKDLDWQDRGHFLAISARVMRRESPLRRALVELKFFLGSTDQETADALDIALHTRQREWYRAGAGCSND